jgi:hypothetical protein
MNSIITFMRSRAVTLLIPSSSSITVTEKVGNRRYGLGYYIGEYGYHI